MVFDTGIDWAHQSFSSKSEDMLLLPQEGGFCDEGGSCYDVDENGHGTFCAGVACGAKQVGTYKDGESFTCCGVAPNAKLGIWKARKNANAESKFVERLKALTEYIQQNTFEKPPIDVLVIPRGMYKPHTDMRECIKTLDDMGIIIVCAGSNDGAARNSIKYPARFPQTICIGSNTSGSKASDFSPEGLKMQFLGIGEHIIGPKSKKCEKKSDCLSEESSKMFSIYKGTSFSAAAVGGLICLILETLKSKREVLCIREELNREFIVELLLHLTRDEGVSWDKKRGFGAILSEKLKQFFKSPADFIKKMRNDNGIV